MKFALIITNLSGGGAEKVFLKICAGLVARGHDLHLILLENIIVHKVPVGVQVHSFTGAGHKVRKGLLGKWLAALRLRRLVKQLQAAQPFDLIISTLPFADEVAIRANLPRHWCRIANTLSVEIERLRLGEQAKAQRRLRRYQRLYSARPLIAVSDGVAHDLRANIGLASAHIVRIYNPYDFAAMRAAALATVEPPAQPYILHVGRFSAQKRHDVLLDAWLELKIPHHLVLMAKPQAALHAMIEARGLAQRVSVIDFQDNPYPWMAGADLLVLASDHEGLPNVIIEALGLGTAVVSTDCPSGPREIFGAALPDCLVPVGDAPALARAITDAVATPPPVDLVDLTRFEACTVLFQYEALVSEAAH